MRRRNFTIIVGILLLESLIPAYSQESECVPSELISGLLGAGRTLPAIRVREFPQGFPAMNLPTGSRLLGSAVFKTHDQVVIASTEGPEESRASLEQELHGAGWRLPDSEMSDGGFVSQVSSNRTLCHPELGMLTLWVSGHESGSYVTLSHTAAPDKGPCVDEEPDVPASQRVLREQLPRLVAPPGIQFSDWRAGGGGYGSDSIVGDEIHCSIVFSSERAAQDLLLVFSEQLQSQGWLHDGSWANPHVMGATWHREPADNLRLIGALLVTTLSDKETEVLFRIVRAGSEQNR